MEISALQKARAAYHPKLPPSLRDGANVELFEGEKTESIGDKERISELFTSIYGSPEITFGSAKGDYKEGPVNVGVILSGGQAPGGHNVIAGILDGVKSLHKNSKVYGFLGGPSGLIDNKHIEITEDILKPYRNTGGFDIIGSGRTKLETEQQFEAAKMNCVNLGINALVIIGGDDSNTNACLLAEYYKSRDIPIRVIGCPKTIDGDLKNDHIEISFGFDTACRVYSELIGNVMRDTMSAKKYWHFIKLMGRSASHIALECALQTHPNVCIISEEVREKDMSLLEIVEHIAEVVSTRAEKDGNFGVCLIPEGLIEFIPEMNRLISELNDIMAENSNYFNTLTTDDDKFQFINQHLSADTGKAFSSLPNIIQQQLLADRDPHGNVQVSRIETEKLIIDMVGDLLRERKAQGKYKGKFSPQSHFFGYEGRCAAPSNFDADYCYSLGYTAAALIGAGRTGYMASVANLDKHADEWKAGGVPITMMMNLEKRHGEDKPVIQKALVELSGKPFTELNKNRDKWAYETHFVFPGPIQYFGPSEVCDQVSRTLKIEQG